MSSIRKIVGWMLSIALLAGGVLTAIYYREIRDQVVVWQYRPSSAVVALADRSGMSDRGRFYFYLARPSLETAEQFNQDCRRIEKASPILGCYDPGAERIHVYDVTHPELEGIKEVTAAHEMLHVVWSRLGQAEQRRLGEVLEAAYRRVVTDKLAERMAYYERAQPGSRANELHSILGTEVADLGEELEQHYRRFFVNRRAVVTLYAGYYRKFVRLEQEADQLSAILTTQKATIMQRKTSYEAGVAAFNQQVATFNARAERGEFESREAFGTERAQLVQRSQVLSQQRRQLEGAVTQYNQQVERLNALGRRLQSLQQGLDSHQEVR